MTHEEKALLFFQDKFHCSQSVLVAYAEELGLTEEQALKIAYCLNSGMRKGEVCGACSGALLVLVWNNNNLLKKNFFLNFIVFLRYNLLWKIFLRCLNYDAAIWGR